MKLTDEQLCKIIQIIDPFQNPETFEIEYDIYKQTLWLEERI